MGLENVDGTFRHPWPGTTPGRPFDPDERVRLTVWFTSPVDNRSEGERAAHLGGLHVRERVYETRAALRARTDTGERIATEFERFCAAHGFARIERHWRSTVISGTLGELAAAFGAHVDIRTSPHGDAFRHRAGWLQLPPHLAPHVRGIFGFHQWYRPERIGATKRYGVPLEPRAVERRYAFPEARGAGQTIGILAYDASYLESDYELAMHRLGVRRSHPILKRVDGERAAHHPDTGADLEAATDVQIAASLAPGARIVVYEAPHDERGCLDAIRTAIFDEEYAPSVLSISYGIVERNWTRAALDLLDDLFIAAALLGISVFVASGDNATELDEDGRPHVNAPASSPFAIACGATEIRSDGAGTVDEIAWHRSGGGFGRAPVPAWQRAASTWAERHGIVPRRGVPDVSAQCEPGYPVYFRGRELSMHGTSTIAPLWAALAARINETAARAHGATRTIGFFAPLLYARSAEVVRPIVRGRNATFEAGAGWNPLAGLGVPNGAALEAALTGD